MNGDMNNSWADTFKGRKVLVTGHTGFKGAWLSRWLRILGADVIGVALDPLHSDGAFNAMEIDRDCIDIRQDINDCNAIMNIFAMHRPELVFHLAAQPLVLESYRFPVETFTTNITGTVNLLEACRQTSSVEAIVVVTSDKCYDNTGQNRGYIESDPLGGKDPYSASKAAAELVANSYRESFFIHDGRVGLATARAGNVIGGGDWAENRIVPDCIKSLHQNKPVVLRHPESTRPWQFVLEPLGGYLLLAAKMLTNKQKYSKAWNFGPAEESVKTVRELAEEIISKWGSGSWAIADTLGESPKREADLLSLDITRARSELNWSPVMSFSESVTYTVEWYKAQINGRRMAESSDDQIKRYQSLLRWR